MSKCSYLRKVTKIIRMILMVPDRFENLPNELNLMLNYNIGEYKADYVSMSRKCTRYKT